MVTREDIPNQPDKIRITFSIPASMWADTVHLAGDFNNWDPATTPLHRDEEAWRITLMLERGHAYAYRYLIDRRDWMPDWNADAYVVGFDGSSRSVVLAQPLIPTSS